MNIKKILRIVDAMHVDTIGGKRLPKRGATSRHDKFADKCPRKFKSPKDYPVGEDLPEDLYDPEAEKQAKADMEASGLYGHVYDSKRHARKRCIKDGGHLYSKDKDGKVHTNSKDTWRGVEGSTFISHGEWSDPEILYNGVEINANDAEDLLYDLYKEETDETGDTFDFDDWARLNPHMSSYVLEVLSGND